MPDTVTIGNATVMPVRDAAISGSPAFLWPDVSEEQLAPWRHYLNERGNLELNVGTFVVRSEGKTVLIDTGLGDKPRENFPQGHLLENLRQAGVNAEEVDLVVITHLHIDHVGWNTVADGNGGWKTTFPRARYVVVRDEWDFFTTNADWRGQEFIVDSVLPLGNSGQLDLVAGNYVVTADLTLVPTPGHTPAHSCVALVSNGEKAIIVGDLAHHPLQLTETQWQTVFDIDRAMACKSREQIARRAEEEGALAIGGHFPWPGFGRLMQLEGRRIWQAI